MRQVGKSIACLIAGCLSIAAVPATASQLQTGDLHLTYHFEEVGKLVPYRLYVPTTYDKDNAYPLLVILHGGGSDENSMFEHTDIQALAERLGIIALSPLGYEPGAGFGNFFPIVTTEGSMTRVRTRAVPNKPASRVTSISSDSSTPTKQESGKDEYAEMPAGIVNEPLATYFGELDVMNVIDHVRRSYNVDTKRIYLTGNSMGGCGTHYLVAHYPQMWAAAAPVGCSVAHWAYPFRRLAEAGIAMLYVHGENDHLSHYSWVKAFSDEASARGVEAEFLLVPDADHSESFNKALPAILEFLLKYEKD